jgi:hypothetical protein
VAVELLFIVNSMQGEVFMMSRKISFLLCCFIVCFAGTGSLHAVDESSYHSIVQKYYDTTQHPSQALKRLLLLEKISSSDIVEETQKKWFRGNCERWEVSEKAWRSEHKEEYMQCFEELGLFERREPQQKEYSSVLVLGSSAPIVASGIQYTLELVEAGKIVDTTICLLAGERALIPQERAYMEGRWGVSGLNDEREMMQALGEKILEGKSWKISLAEKKEGAPRATTEDTIRQWLQDFPAENSSKHLLISQQPFCDYQHLIAVLIIQDIEGKDFTFDCAGRGVSEQHKALPNAVSLVLDSIAHVLYFYEKVAV